MLYTVQEGDTLSTISKKFQTTVQAILSTNAICNPEFIPEGHILYIPEPGRYRRWCGAFPYYLVQPGDTPEAVASRFNTFPDILLRANGIGAGNNLFPYMELLIEKDIPEPEALMKKWKETIITSHGMPAPLEMHNIFYEGSFQWKALGRDAYPCLLELLRHQNDTIRLYAAISMARLAPQGRVVRALNRAPGGRNTSIRRIIGYALQRGSLSARGMARIHILAVDSMLFKNPDRVSPGVVLKKGTKLTVLQWHIPGLQTFDHVQVLSTGETGFLPRYLYDEIPVV